MHTLELFHFLRPYWLLALLPLFGLLFLTLRAKRNHAQWEKLCDKELLPYIIDDRTSTKHYWHSLPLVVAGILSIFALAGPTWQKLPAPVFHNNSALVIALDLSRSMDATDIKPSRLIRARYKVTDILKKRKDGLTALLVYAGDTFTVTPLTDDTQTIESQLNALTTDIMPSQGSNTEIAIQSAVDLLKQAEQTQGDILLITDGINDNINSNLHSILGSYRLSVLGVGTKEGSPIPLDDSGQLLKDRHGNIVIPKLDESSLSSLAHTAKGSYRTISNNDNDINAILSLLDQSMPQSVSKTQRMLNVWDDKGPWLLLLVLPFAALYFRKGLLLVPLIALNIPQPSYAFTWQDLWETDQQQAQTLFDQGKYKEAQQKFKTPEWKAAAQYKAKNYDQAMQTLDALNSDEAYYNKGNSLAKSKKYKEAIAAYQQALELNPQHEDALYNKNLVEQALKEQQNKQDQNKSSKSDKDQSQQQKQDDSSPNSDEQKQQEQQQKSKSDASKQQQQNQENSSQDSDEQKQQDQQQQSKSDASKQQQQKQDDSSQDSDEQKQQEHQQQSKSDASKQQQQQDDSSQDSDEQKQQELQQQQSKSDASEQQQQAATTMQQKQEMTEKERANAQWLQRVPDDPSGLLKRKFKYQYQQRTQSQQQEQQW